MAKCVAICNGLLFAFYMPRFKNYRNSYLLPMQFAVSLAAIQIGAYYSSPLIYAYVFEDTVLDPKLAIEDLKIDPQIGFTVQEKDLLNRVLRHSYTTNFKESKL